MSSVPRPEGRYDTHERVTRREVLHSQRTTGRPVSWGHAVHSSLWLLFNPQVLQYSLQDKRDCQHGLQERLPLTYLLPTSTYERASVRRVTIRTADLQCIRILDPPDNQTTELD